MDSLKVNALIKALDTGSMSAAAESLGYTTSGISQMITSIENELGFQIVTRGRSGVALTKAGEMVFPALMSYAHADAIIQQVASEVKGLTSGKIVIGSFSSIAANWLPDIIKAFKKDYPDIQISLLEGIHKEIDKWMNDSRIDFCLYSYRADTDMEWIDLYEDPLLAVVYPEHPFAKRESISPEELIGEPFIMPGRGRDLDVVEFLERYGISPDIQYSTLENYSAMSMIENGLGISVMNELITEGRLNRIVLVPFDPPQSIKMGIAIPGIRDLSPAAKRFIDYVKQYVINDFSF